MPIVIRNFFQFIYYLISTRQQENGDGDRKDNTLNR